MDSKVKHYIESQPQNRQGILTDIHLIIVQEDKTVVPIVEPIMAKEMIVYKGKGFMKYGKLTPALIVCFENSSLPLFSAFAFDVPFKLLKN